MKRGVEFPGHIKVNATIERHLAMVYENQTDSCLPCQNDTAKYPQTWWRCKDMGAPPRDPAPPLPETPPVPPGNYEVAHSLKIEGVPPGYVDIHIALPST